MKCEACELEILKNNHEFAPLMGEQSELSNPSINEIVLLIVCVNYL